MKSERGILCHAFLRCSTGRDLFDYCKGIVEFTEEDEIFFSVLISLSGYKEQVASWFCYN